MHGDVFKDRSRSSATFKMELFAAVANDRAYKQLTLVSRCCCVTQLSLYAKLKLDENGHHLKAASDTFSCFPDMFLHFSETPIPFCLTDILLHFEY